MLSVSSDCHNAAFCVKKINFGKFVKNMSSLKSMTSSRSIYLIRGLGGKVAFLKVAFSNIFRKVMFLKAPTS